MLSPSYSGHERSPSPPEARRIVVAHRLPLRAEPNPDAPHGFDFSLDPDALPFQLSRGLPQPVIFVGVLPPAAADSIPESDEISTDLLTRFSCHPVFLDTKLHADFYDGFCMWPVLHYSVHPYNKDLYHVFLTANMQFANHILDVLNTDQDLVFIHDYHLWALPTLLRRKSPHARIGFLLHSPFPTPEIFHTMPVRKDLLGSLLNADIVGFQSFDCACYFLSCCARVLGISYRTKQGYIGIDYNGRRVLVNILSVGIDIDQLHAVLPCTRYVSRQDVVYSAWARSLDQDLLRASKDNSSMVILKLGLAMSFRVAALGPNFQKLSPEHINLAYHQTGNRLILLDYDGTVIPQKLINKAPSQEVIRTLNELCSDPKNTVFLVSGRGKDELAQWFAPCKNLGISAEHGYFTRWSKDSPWESCKLVIDSNWKKIAVPIMELYTETTVGSSIEGKETSLVWHYEKADRDLGPCQAKELQSDLQSLLANEAVYVNRGQKIVEVNPEGLDKGVAVEHLVSAMGDRGNFSDFILCVGDDRSDEDMFEATTTGMKNRALAETVAIFPCTIGYKPSLAKYYLDEQADVLKMLRGLTQL
uniref:Uncharacterized protein n=1 Tax=Avena sativa TaxID=4498 RepID=A0ACD6AHM9_AVESA